jgi:hypothetical protein
VNVLREKDMMEGSKDSLFRMTENGIVRMRNRVYLPDNRDLKEEILKEAHESKLAIHPGSTKMYRDLKSFYWWPNMKKEIVEFVAKCVRCQHVKIEHQKPAGRLQPLLIQEWKRGEVTMDFMIGLPKSKKGNDTVWVIVDRLTKFALFLPVKMTYSVDKLTRIFINEVVRLHGISISIVSDRDPRFTSKL